jgi:hypothetical protein
LNIIDSIVGAIAKQLEKGILLPETLLFFAESTYGMLPEDLEAVINDDLSDEADTLRSLIFSPDEPVQLAVEPILLRRCCCPQEKDAVVMELARRLPSICLYTSDKAITFSLRPAARDFVDLVDKLHLDRSIDQRLSTAIEKNLAGRTRLAARIMVRHCPDRLSSAKVDFLCLFIEKGGTTGDDFPELFKTTLKLVNEIKNAGASQDCAEFFLARKQALIKLLKEIAEFEQKRERYSMEYLLMQRYRVPPQSRENVLGELRRLMIITDQILGLEDRRSLVPFRDLGSIDPSDDLARLIDLLR